MTEIISRTYDRAELAQILTDLEVYFAELHYIDRALRYLDEQEARWYHELAPGVESVNVELGTVAPFTRRLQVPGYYVQRLPWQDRRQDEVDNHLRALREQARTWAADNMAHLRARLEPYTFPSPAGYEHSLVAPVESVHDILRDRVSDDVGKLDHSIRNWEGEAADNFHTHFYQPFAETRNSQLHLLGMLAGALVTAKAIVESAQHSVMDVADKARQLLREQLEWRALRARIDAQESTRTALIVASAGAGLVGGLLAGGAGAAISMQAASGGLALAATAIPESWRLEHELRGHGAEGVLDALVEAIGILDKPVAGMDDELDEDVKKMLEWARGMRGRDSGVRGGLIPPRPELVHGVDWSDFHLPRLAEGW
jgi:hypothetical protein